MTEEENTWLITRTKIEKLQSCNYHEADTRLIFHAEQSTAPVIIRATDTNVLILLSYGCNGCKPLHDWMMKIYHRYISVNKLTTHFGEEVCEFLPAYHSITGCDTTSFPFRIGKIKPIKKLMKQGKSHLLSELGSSLHPVQDVTKAKCFFRTCMYSGSEQERFVETRVTMYTTQKVKYSSSLLPDESSTNEYLKRSDLQTLGAIPVFETEYRVSFYQWQGMRRNRWWSSANMVYLSATPAKPLQVQKKNRKNQQQGKWS